MSPDRRAESVTNLSHNWRNLACLRGVCVPLDPSSHLPSLSLQGCPTCGDPKKKADPVDEAPNPRWTKRATVPAGGGHAKLVKQMRSLPICPREAIKLFFLKMLSDHVAAMELKSTPPFEIVEKLRTDVRPDGR